VLLILKDFILKAAGYGGNASTWEAGAVGSQVQDQPGLHNETLFKRIRIKEKEK
jgi:hypothetical protein